MLQLWHHVAFVDTSADSYVKKPDWIFHRLHEKILLLGIPIHVSSVCCLYIPLSLSLSLCEPHDFVLMTRTRAAGSAWAWCAARGFTSPSSCKSRPPAALFSGRCLLLFPSYALACSTCSIHPTNAEYDGPPAATLPYWLCCMPPLTGCLHAP